MSGTAVLLCLATAPAAAAGPLRCTLAGSLTFSPAIDEVPVATTATVAAHAALCSDDGIAYATISGTLQGQAGKHTARLTGVLTYRWRLKADPGELNTTTETSTQQVVGIGIGGGYSFEGTTTAGRYAGRGIQITPLVPDELPAGPAAALTLFNTLKIK